MLDSTRIMLKNHGWRIDRFVHNYIYFAFYRPYVLFVLWLFRILAAAFSWFKPLNVILSMAFNRYHAKIISMEDATKIFTLNEDVVATSAQNKRIIPFTHAYKIMLKDADTVAVMDCPCIVAKKGRTELGDCAPINRCLAVGKGLASFWVDHCRKYNARYISQQEAIDLIKDFRRRGHVTQAFFKVATGGRTGVFCNCCPECCVSLEATKLGQKFNSRFTQSAPSGYSVLHDAEKCKNCGSCAKVCHFDAIEFKDSKRFFYQKWNCMGCGLCIEHCPHGALSLYVDESKPLPLDIDLVKERFADNPGLQRDRAIKQSTCATDATAGNNRI
ncbi:MAG TPA: 4Fe-4S binding protein [Deltaproteobacteria bacterium]|nr:4Fe-4S binding protein [Deltaproteobacteria bacterium]